MDRQRIDKWLWHARVVRTRNAAAALVANGLVRVNSNRVNAPSHPVRAGDVVTVALDRVRVLRVVGFSERRGAAPDAALLSENLQSDNAPNPVSETVFSQPSSGARPSRRERKEILRLKRLGNE